MSQPQAVISAYVTRKHSRPWEAQKSSAVVERRSNTAIANSLMSSVRDAVRPSACRKRGNTAERNVSSSVNNINGKLQRTSKLCMKAYILKILG